MIRPNGSAIFIFQRIIDVMQEAEELGGPEGQDYGNLMRAVANEARDRLRSFHGIGLNCFDDFEIHAEADAWCLHGHIPGEGLTRIGEFRTRGHAEEVYARITGQPYSRAIKEGDRFKLVREVVRFPDFIARPGLTGTVTAVSGGIRGRIDEPVRGAEAWDNELHWDSLVEFVADTEPRE
jgi:hypothetical protein